MKAPAKDNRLYFSILLAFVLWVIMFVFRPLNFWVMLTFSTSLLAALSYAFGRPLIRPDELKWKNVLWGILLAAALYGIFWIGNQGLILISHWFPEMLPDRLGKINAVYANLGALPPALVGILLFFPIGFGEEIFWRGFVQRRFGEKWNGCCAYILTTLLYTGVHLPTGNPVLITAALTCGLFWGGVYWITGSLLPVLISHMLWDPAIFIIWPIR
jgi:membrane protease YdiL (CAAX protease family)